VWREATVEMQVRPEFRAAWIWIFKTMKGGIEVYRQCRFGTSIRLDALSHKNSDGPDFRRIEEMNDYLKTLMLATSLALPLAMPALAQPAAGPHGTTGSLGGTTSIRGLSPNNGQTGQGGATSGQTGTMSGQNGAATGLTTGTASTTGGTTSGMSANNGHAGAVPGQSSAISATNEDTIRSMLKSQGYADIDGLRHDGSKYTIRSAERYGKKVHNISTT
jgi:hypothetical protein